MLTFDFEADIPDIENFIGSYMLHGQLYHVGCGGLAWDSNPGWVIMWEERHGAKIRKCISLFGNTEADAVMFCTLNRSHVGGSS